jgi:hypothetical protein
VQKGARAGAFACAFLVWLTTIAHGETCFFKCEDGDHKEITPCTVSLAPHSFTAPVLRVEAGRSVEVPPGTYDLRASARGYALGLNATLFVAAEGETASISGQPHVTLMTLGPGGTVILDRSAILETGAAQLLSFSTGRIDTLFLNREESAPFPAGKFVAIGFKGPDQILGVTKILNLSAREEKRVTEFDRPTPGNGHLLIQVQFPSGRRPGVARDVRTEVVGPPGLRSPTIESDNSLLSYHGLYYNLPAGRYSIRLRSGFWAADAVETEVRKGELTIESRLAPKLRPTLAIDVRADPPLQDAERAVTIYSCPASELEAGAGPWPELKRCSVEYQGKFTGDHSETTRFNPGKFFALLRIGNLRKGRVADLTDGQDHTELFEFKKIRLFGRVARGGEGVSARLTITSLETLEQEADGQSDPSGNYETYVWRVGGFAATVEPSGQELGPPPMKFRFMVPRVDSFEKDFNLASNKVLITVRDSKTGQPLPTAHVNYRDGVSSQVATANSAGVVSLPLLFPGKFRCSAEAEGYFPEQAEFQVADQEEPQRFEISLKPQTDSLAFTAYRPDGTPATGAIALVGYNPGKGYREQIPCDDQGTCRFPNEPSRDDLLFLACPSAGLTVTTVGQALDSGSVTMRPAGGELKIFVHNGSQPPSQLVLGSVALDGLILPPYLLETTGVTRGLVYPNRGEPFLYTSLPAGSIQFSVYSTGGFDAGGAPIIGDMIAGPVQVTLPQTTEISVQLP